MSHKHTAMCNAACFHVADTKELRTRAICLRLHMHRVLDTQSIFLHTTCLKAAKPSDAPIIHASLSCIDAQRRHAGRMYRQRGP